MWLKPSVRKQTEEIDPEKANTMEKVKTRKALGKVMVQTIGQLDLARLKS